MYVNKPTLKDKDIARRGGDEISEAIISVQYDVVVLDEANIAIYYNLFTFGQLIDLLMKKQEETEIIITGRYAPVDLIELADLVTEMQEIKHYYTQGVQAREGIEY